MPNYTRIVSAKDAITKAITVLDTEIGVERTAEFVVATCQEQGVLVASVTPKDLNEVLDEIARMPRVQLRDWAKKHRDFFLILKDKLDVIQREESL